MASSIKTVVFLWGRRPSCLTYFLGLSKFLFLPNYRHHRQRCRMGMAQHTLSQLHIGSAVGSPVFVAKGLKSVRRLWISQTAYQEE